jgi:hypothetical protein
MCWGKFLRAFYVYILAGDAAEDNVVQFDHATLATVICSCTAIMCVLTEAVGYAIIFSVSERAP